MCISHHHHYHYRQSIEPAFLQCLPACRKKGDKNERPFFIINDDNEERASEGERERERKFMPANAFSIIHQNANTNCSSYIHILAHVYSIHVLLFLSFHMHGCTLALARKRSDGRKKVFPREKFYTGFPAGCSYITVRMTDSNKMIHFPSERNL